MILFTDKGPSIVDITEGRYCNVHISIMRNHFKTLSAYVQKFFVALRMIHACNPTGGKDDNIKFFQWLFRFKLGETNKMAYDYKDFEKIKWMAKKSWIVLRYHPKLMYNATMAEGATLNGSNSKYNLSSPSHDVQNSTSFQQSPI